MSEVNRWTLENAGTDDLLVIASGPTMETPVRVREDRPTETDIKRVACFLAHRMPTDRYMDEAHDLLTLVFGEGDEQ